MGMGCCRETGAAPKPAESRARGWGSDPGRRGWGWPGWGWGAEGSEGGAVAGGGEAGSSAPLGPKEDRERERGRKHLVLRCI